MKIMFKSKLQIIGAVAVVAMAIHIIFCIQVVMALPNAMALDGSLLIFFPHYFLMECLPIPYPLIDNSVNYQALLEKLFLAFPASIIYAFLIVGVLKLLRR